MDIFSLSEDNKLKKTQYLYNCKITSLPIFVCVCVLVNVVHVKARGKYGKDIFFQSILALKKRNIPHLHSLFIQF